MKYSFGYVHLYDKTTNYIIVNRCYFSGHIPEILDPGPLCSIYTEELCQLNSLCPNNCAN